MSTSVNGVGTISSAGIGSGLDVNSIVTQLMAVEQRPLTQLQSQASTLNTQVSTFGKLQSYFSALQDKSTALTESTLWSGTTATSADATSVSVTTGTNAVAGNYAVDVQNLASVQTVTTAAGVPAASTFGAGTLTITLGTYDEAGSGLPATAFHAGSTSTTVNITATDTLQSIADKINAAGAGVSASLITDASGVRLSVQSSSTGADHAFQITSSGGSSLPLDFDATNAASSMQRGQTAANANATINGIAVTSASNSLNDVVTGLNINLLKQTSTPVNIAVATDSASIKQGITDLVTAFNNLASFAHTNTAYNATTKTGGPLQGDQSVNSLQQALRNVINQASAASTTFSRLSDIGITMQLDGTLATDSTKLDNALGNLSELKKLFATKGTDAAGSGFAMRWKTVADAALAIKGTFKTRTDSLNARLARNSKSQDALQTRLAQTEARLRAQYTALDTKMGQLNGLSTYITQQIAQMNKSTA